ncbi:zinc ABC transporter substrate-binding protein [Neogemmobacter tilapiae]|uniref:High-affinity zinc uptake system protein ZnuA n=1 Tax=Neogemmobacter tilapiae TaxID=875041 RepID=A0A918U1C1_9RHOB|nr:zinc ABC transporter substrate-binding protein [Gemmobacter tilapiae]GHC65926.1 zinc ABC transporter substrate-binding protein [Gemmobacter tilapiae]
MRYTIALAVSTLMAGPALAEVPVVVTDIPPVHSLVAQVMGDLGTPVLLLEQGGNAHSYQMKPSQVQALAEAGLVVWIGPEMTPWLERGLEGTAGQARQLVLLHAEGTEALAYGEAGAHDHEGHDDAEHDHEEHDHEGHDHGPEGGHDHDHEAEGHHHEGLDPHAWLDPHNAEAWLGLIAGELSTLDPDNAATYAANAEKAQAEIEALEAELTATLAPVQGKPFVVFHDAYNYFTGHFGLTVAGTIALGDAASPGAARLSELRSGLEAGAALCIFPEAAHDAKQVEQMAEGAAVKLGGALEPEGSTLEPGPALYGQLMRGLAQTLADCLKG